jgi:hypothetical protein
VARSEMAVRVLIDMPRSASGSSPLVETAKPLALDRRVRVRAGASFRSAARAGLLGAARGFLHGLLLFLLDR